MTLITWVQNIQRNTVNGNFHCSLSRRKCKPFRCFRLTSSVQSSWTCAQTGEPHDDKPKGVSKMEKGRILWEWLNQHGAKVEGVRFAPVKGMGFGVVSRSEFSPGQTVMEVPLEVEVEVKVDDLTNSATSPVARWWRAVALSSELVESPALTNPLGAIGRSLAITGLGSRLESQLDEAGGGGGGDDFSADSASSAGGVVELAVCVPWNNRHISLLALALLHQRAQGEGAWWSAYIGVLDPRPQSPLLWSEAQISHLQASPLVAKIRSRQRGMRRAYSTLFPRLTEIDPITFPSEAFTWDLWQWAVVTVSQRAFHIPESDIMVLCPGLDSVNHRDFADRVSLSSQRPHPAPLTASARTSQPARMSFKVMEGCRKGEQLFHEYADYTAGGTLLEYGFVPTDALAGNITGNIPSAVTLDLSTLISLNDPFNHRRLQILEELDLLGQLQFEVVSSHVWNSDWSNVEKDHNNSADADSLLIPENLWPTARVLTFSFHDVDNEAKAFTKAKFGSPDAFGSEHEHAMLSAMVGLVEAQLAQYATTSDQDREVAVVPQVAMEDETRDEAFNLALVTRCGEKELLKLIATILGNRLYEVS